MEGDRCSSCLEQQFLSIFLGPGTFQDGRGDSVGVNSKLKICQFTVKNCAKKICNNNVQNEGLGG